MIHQWRSAQTRYPQQPGVEELQVDFSADWFAFGVLVELAEPLHEFSQELPQGWFSADGLGLMACPVISNPRSWIIW